MIIFITRFLLPFALVSLLTNEIKALDDVPQIVKAEQKSEQEIKLEWKVDNLNLYDPRRYRVIYTKVSSNDQVFEWPAQIKRTDLIIFDYTRAIVTTSSFECFNECIKDATCIGVFRTYRKPNVTNCYLKTENNILNASDVSVLDTEYVEIDNIHLQDNSSKIELHNMPYNEIYRFKVAFYDMNTRTWSNFSEFSEIVNTTVWLSFTFRRTGFLTGKIQITQKGRFTNYTISRHAVSIIEPGSFGLGDEKQLESFSLEPSYYNQNYREIVYTQTLLDCQNECIETDFCILFIYYNDDNEIENLNATTCVLQFDLDIQTAVYKNKASNVFSLKSVSSEIDLDLEINGQYKFELAGYTPYGSQIVSPDIIYYNFTDYITVVLTMVPNSPPLSLKLNWTVKNLNSTPDRFQIFIKEPRESYYYLEESSDYDDPNAEYYILDYIEQCYLKCFNDPRCLAYTWDDDDSECYLKFTTEFPKECDTAESVRCFIISKYKNEIEFNDYFVNREYCYEVTVQTVEGYKSEKSNLLCVIFDFEVNMKAWNEFTEGDHINNIPNIECQYRSIYNAYIRNITWLKDNSTEIFNSLITELDFVGNTIYFKNLTRNKFDGVYECQVFLYQEQYIQSSNKLDIIVSFPSSLKIDATKNVRYNISDNTHVSCILDGYPKQDLIWQFVSNNSSHEVNEVEYYNSSNTRNEIVLSFKNLTKSQQGLYKCATKNSNISDQISLIVQTLPSEPVLLNVSVVSKSTYIKWSVEDTGELDLTKLLIEWSKNFSDSSILPYSRYFDYQKLKNNEMNIDFKLPNSNEIRISVFNILGESAKSKILVLNYSDNDVKKNHTYLILFIVMAVLLVSVSSVIVGYIVYMRTKLKRRSGMLLADTHMDEISLNDT